MALPSNYKQIAVGAPTGPSTPAPRSRSSAGGGSDRNKDTTPIFTHSNYGNPAFTPQKAGKSSSSKSQTESRAPKPPKPPEKPVLPYMRYSKRIWDSVKAQHPDLKLWELGKKIGAMWKSLRQDEKQEFIDEYEAEKVEYEKALKAYHNSPAYQAFMQAKSKVKSDADMHETPSRSSKSTQERRIDIQPAEDEDDQDEGHSFKHVSYARYLRNHRLINEIFSDAVVPDVRSVVTTQRMQVLKRQVCSLTHHQTKLEQELQQMEEKFEAKKQRMVESSEAFQEELKRHCKPAVDDEKFQNMVLKMYEDMKRDRQRMAEDPNAYPGHPMMHGPTQPPTRGAAATEEKPQNAPLPTSVPHADGATAELAAAIAPTAEAQTDIDNADKKDDIAASHTPATTPTAAKLSAQLESESKTEPEPMDIEPTPQPSVPLPPPPKTEAMPMKEITLAAAKPPMEVAKEIMVKPPSKTPSPAPTPPAVEMPQPPAVLSNPPSATPPPAAVIPPPQPPPHQQPQQSPLGAAPLGHLPQPQQPPPPPPQQQVPPNIPMHPHMPPHPGYHPGYGPTRSPYYQPQYGAHPPPQGPYGQYGPYSHYQQPYGPPGSHYMSARPPHHYGEHAQPHDVYGQPPPPQQQPMPASVPADAVPKPDADKKEGE